VQQQQQQQEQTVTATNTNTNTTITATTTMSRISAETRKAWEPLHVDFIEQPLVLVIKVKANAPRQPSPLEIPGKSLRQLTCDYGVISLQGFTQVDPQDLEKACALVGDVLYWPQWGAVFEIKTVQDTKLTGQTLERMAMHYDGMYKKKHEDSTELGDVPLFQMFHCVEAYPEPDADKTTSGRTLFAHTNACQRTDNVCAASRSSITRVSSATSSSRTSRQS
jgi:alpha-ketoglutarate-dependent taurine dioxygenase